MIKVKVKWILDKKEEEKSFISSDDYNTFMREYGDEAFVSERKISYVEEGKILWRDLPDCNKCGDYEYCALRYDDCTGFIPC